jgi:biopolymer transport protein ExbB/TolQ
MAALKAAELAMARSAAVVDCELRRGLGSLPWIASAALRLGVFIGLVNFLEGFGGQRSEGTTFETLALGVLYESLALSMVGLVVVLAAMWFYKNLTNQVAAFNVEMENTSVKLIDVLSTLPSSN